jgi:hypothetical protein
MDNQTVRHVYVIGPDKKIKLVISYPISTGRNFDEVLRVIDSMQLTAQHKVATPANWRDGDKVIILPASLMRKPKRNILTGGPRGSRTCATFRNHDRLVDAGRVRNQNGGQRGGQHL